MFVARIFRLRLNSVQGARSFHKLTTMERDYNAAVAALNTLQSNFSIVDAIRKSGKGMNKLAIPEMIEWCRKSGHEPEEFDKLKPIHIAGTKGKGSTSAFIASILAQYLPSPDQQNPKLRKIGLYTSPHLRFVRERIQINNEPISEAQFAKYFFEIWNRLEAAAKAEGKPADEPSSKPVYFRYLTLMAFHAYLQENVDTAVIECGIGGEYDSTNIIVSPTVTAVTSLGIDHTAVLGSTLPEIAWHKAGIFKPGAVAFSAPQPDEAIEVLKQRAAERNVQLHIVPRHPELDSIPLGLSADFQKTNASLAIAVAAAHLRSLGHTDIPDPTTNPSIPLPAEFRRGLETVRWPGRCEVRREAGVAWHIDGGHTLDSIAMAGKWFAEQILAAQSNADAPRILIFNQQTRDASALARALYTTLQAALPETASSNQGPFTHAIFTTNLTFAESGYKPDLVSVNDNAADVDSLAVQRALAGTWAELDPKAEVKVVRTIEEAVSEARRIAREQGQGREAMALITGSLHLVGGALEVLESGSSGL